MQRAHYCAHPNVARVSDQHAFTYAVISSAQAVITRTPRPDLSCATPKRNININLRLTVTQLIT